MQKDSDSDSVEHMVNFGTPIVSACVLPPKPGAAGKGFKELNIPRNQLPQVLFPIQEAQRWLTLTSKSGKTHRFPLPTILPKVMKTRYVPKGKLPRDVEIDRLRRERGKIDIVQELAKAGLTDEILQPTEEQYLLSEYAYRYVFPLSYFDDSNYDIHSPKAWFDLGVVGNAHYPLPARAYLPTNKSLLTCKWVTAAVIEHNPQTDMWTLLSLDDDCYYKVPKLQFVFFAENPHKYVERLKAAVQERHKGEQLMLMELIVDCVLHDDIEAAEFQTLKPIEKILGEAKCSEQMKKQLRVEVCLVFERLMALYELEKLILLMPKEFPQFRNINLKASLPKAFHVNFSETEGKALKALKINMKERRHNYLNSTLFYCAGGIEAMSGVSVECQIVDTRQIFVCAFNKPMPLADFLQSQEGHSDNVSTFLKVYWPLQITTVITSVLRALGKGWLDIGLTNWTVYNMCKISRFILQVKFRMQEAVYGLLRRSLSTFSHFICDPCIQFLNLKNDYVWKSGNYKDTEFPFPKPVFSLTLMMSEERKAYYSTDPEDFKPGALDIFKRCLEKSSAVQCIDANVITGLKFAPNLYILTVEMIEEFYVIEADLMERCYDRAVLPLRSYAQLYDKYVPFYLLNVVQHMTEYIAQNRPSSQIKQDIMDHKQEKEDLKAKLPGNITIGPFNIVVDAIKQSMIRKHTELVKRIFDYYVDRMSDTNDALLDVGRGIFNKIAARPISIEHLYEIRDYALTSVPEELEKLRADLQVMWLEYDLLDSFNYNLSDVQFATKWNAYAMPYQITQRLSTLKEEQKVDIEEFARMHSSECSGFEERLESLNDEVQTYSLQFNASRAAETAVDIKKTAALIKELEKIGKTLQYRQELFELEPLSLEFLENIVSSFQPYKNLWSACSNFLKLEEATLGNPIIQIDLDEVWINLMNLRGDLEQSLHDFVEKNDIKLVAIAFMKRIDDFIPLYNSIVDIRNENWMFIHWQYLSHILGQEIKYSISMNYQLLIRKGILDFLPEVHELAMNAATEAAKIQQEMEEAERKQEEEAKALLLRKQNRICRRDIL